MPPQHGFEIILLGEVLAHKSYPHHSALPKINLKLLLAKQSTPEESGLDLGEPLPNVTPEVQTPFVYKFLGGSKKPFQNENKHALLCLIPTPLMSPSMSVPSFDIWQNQVFERTCRKRLKSVSVTLPSDA